MDSKWENYSEEDETDMLDGIDECYCSDCKWNDDGHCMIYEDDLATLGEDCPYRGE